MKIYDDISTEEIATVFTKKLNNPEIWNDLEEALYHLKAIAENEYNNDYWRTLYRALQDITRYV